MWLQSWVGTIENAGLEDDGSNRQDRKENRSCTLTFFPVLLFVSFTGPALSIVPG